MKNPCLLDYETEAHRVGEPLIAHFSEITLRDIFAAFALPTLMMDIPSDSNWRDITQEREIAQQAYRLADALLDERAKPIINEGGSR